MRIIIDKGIPFLDGVFGSDMEVLYLSPEAINAEIVRDADALFVRTRTRIDKKLLYGSKVRFVATATIGFDHIDQVYCNENGIKWTSCPGCNAQAVCDYIEEVLSSLQPNRLAENENEERSVTIGIVGYGNVGRLVATMAEKKGYRVLLSDPPLGIGMTLQEMVPACDVLTFHTPLSYEGEYSTYHMCDTSVLRSCKSDVLLINAARGGVIDEKALLEHLRTKEGKKMRVAIDCWENEPQVDIELLNRVDLASFHIAGYSISGKMRASEMCLRAFCEFFSLPILSINKKVLPLQGDSECGWLFRISEQLKSHPSEFELLRKQYKLR